MPEFQFDFDNFQFEDWKGKLSIPDNLKTANRFRADYNDIDLNRHINNTKYIERALSVYLLSFIDSHHLRKLEANFLAEALYGDEIIIKASNTEELVQFVSFVKAEDEKEACRIRLEWE